MLVKESPNGVLNPGKSIMYLKFWRYGMSPIYEPKGAAKEYGDYALNIYTGCPHRCPYCYVPGVLRRDRETFHSVVEPRAGIVEKTRRQL